MFAGTIRPVETRTETATGLSLESLREQFDALTPAGWELVDVKATLAPGGASLNGTARIERRDGGREIEAPTLDALRAQVPDGWRLLSARDMR